MGFPNLIVLVYCYECSVVFEAILITSEIQSKRRNIYEYMQNHATHHQSNADLATTATHHQRHADLETAATDSQSNADI